MKNIKNTFFACLLIVSVLFTAASSAKSLVHKEADRRYAFYQKALYEAAEEMSALQVTLKKLTVTQSKAMETEYLSKISLLAASVQNSLSTLPIGVHEAKDAMKFVNQAGDFALSALKKISKGGALTEEDKKILLALLETSTQMCITLGELTQAFSEGKITLNENREDIDGEFQNLTHPKDEYPTLLYDGPFSDSLLDRKMKGLGENDVSMEEAKKALSEFWETELDDIEFLHETKGNEETYVFRMKNTNSEAAVTKRGGKVLYVLSDLNHREEKLDAQKCIEISKDFLYKKGFGQTHAGYYRKYEGIITVNLAPIEDEVILYPDLVKIEVDMESGNIIGMENTNYYMNHVKRNLVNDNWDVSVDTDYGDMNVLSVKPALIPIDANEKAAIEIHVKDENNEYLIYKDAETGEEIMLYEVVHTSDGTIVQ